MNYFDCHLSVQILGLVNSETSTARNSTDQFIGTRSWWVSNLSISHGREEENIAILEQESFAIDCKILTSINLCKR